MQYKIIEAANLPEGEKIYLKKDWMGWRMVHPNKDPETGKINWLNMILGGKRNAVALLFIVLLAIFAYIGFKEMLLAYQFPFDNPIEFCAKYVRLQP